MFHRILVAIDGSRRLEVIVNAAASLALAVDASVHILCAVDPAYFLEEANGVRPSSTDELDYPAAASEREREREREPTIWSGKLSQSLSIKV